MLAVAASVWFIRKRRKSRRQDVDIDDDHNSPSMVPDPFPVQIVPLTQTGESPVPVCSLYKSLFMVIVAHITQRTTNASGQTYADVSPGAVLDSNYAPARPQKSGAIASSPPHRDETYGAPVLSSLDVTNYSNQRHEDSAVLTSAFGLGRSNSGRLPPSYQPR